LLVVSPHTGPRRAERAKKILSNQSRALLGYQGGALGWFAMLI
jgi:hypothetical protein